MPDVTIPLGKTAAHGITLVANQVSTVTFTENIGLADVISDGSAEVYYTTDGTTPTIAGNNTYRIPAGAAGVDTRATTNTASGDVVKLISSGTPTISVQRGDQ